MSIQHRQIGFSSQRLRYEWVDRVARMTQGGMDPAEIKQAIDAMLAPYLSSAEASGRGSREKVTTILERVWVHPSDGLISLRNEGLDLLSGFQAKARLIVHWGMVMAAYPFWCDVASETGRLLRLQGHVTAGQVRRRLIESYGDREVVARATRNVMRSFLEWGCLEETSVKGSYRSASPVSVTSERSIAWLAEAYLRACRLDRAPLDTILGAPCFFPFQIKPITVERLAAASESLGYLKHGLDDALVMLANQEG